MAMTYKDISVKIISINTIVQTSGAYQTFGLGDDGQLYSWDASKNDWFYFPR